MHWHFRLRHLLKMLPDNLRSPDTVSYTHLLLLDEPLGALDLKLRQDMQYELIRLKNELGITFIYVTHDQEEALTLSLIHI